MIVCPSCGTENPATAKFCSECGTRLLPPEPASPPPPSDTIASATPDSEPTPEPESPSQAAAPSTDFEPPKKDTSGLPPAWMPPPVTLQSRPSGQVSTPPPPPATRETVGAVPEAPIPAGASAEKDASGLPPVWMPPPVTPTFQGGGGSGSGGGSGTDDEWKMSDLGPVPERKNRRLWLWIPVALMSLVLICCIGIFIWSATIGEDTVNRWATEGAIERTEEALSGDE